MYSKLKTKTLPISYIPLLICICVIYQLIMVPNLPGPVPVQYL